MLHSHAHANTNHMVYGEIQHVFLVLHLSLLFLLFFLNNMSKNYSIVYTNAKVKEQFESIDPFPIQIVTCKRHSIFI